jgi:hypothetical protein
MQKNKRPWLSLLIAGAANVAAGAACAAGLGGSGSAAVLGQPLDYLVQVRLDAGETLTPECVGAEVTVGDRRLHPTQVRALLETQGAELARIRVVTLGGIDEPVVSIQVHAGCSSRVSRRFVVLADPPVIAPATPAPTPVLAAPAFAATPPAAPPEPAAPAAETAADAARVSGEGPTTRSVAQLRVAPRSSANAPTRAERRAAMRVAANNSSSRGDNPPRSAQRRARKAAVAAAEPTPRLKLESAEPLPSRGAPATASAEALAVEQALEAVAQAASAAREAASAASAAALRIATLEQQVKTLGAEAKGQRDFAAQLRDRLRQAEDASRWFWPMVVLVALLAALALWLGRRLVLTQRAQQQLWRQAAAPATPPPPASEITPSRQPTTPIPFVTSELRPVPSRPASTPAWPPPAPVPPPAMDIEATQPLAVAPAPAVRDSAVERTDILPVHSRSEEHAPRDVSIEELIDLEQQAEFFVVLGQDDAAIDLLMEHLRNTGGGSPLPYLKLLEIYKRRGDREDYERTRTRFNHRFNAYAPDWGIDLAAGRSLEDYSGVVPRLQQVWARPLDAMAEMEALLFRKSRGELFDLTAYRELMFLYALARDLLDREAADTGNVDLLLPLADGSEFSNTAPAPFLGLEREHAPEKHDPDDRPTLPLDFDLSGDAIRPASIFDPLDDGGAVKTRRR